MNDNVRIKVISFCKEYSEINLDIKNKNKAIYELMLIAVHEGSIKDGCMVEKVYKTYSKGTRVKYRPFINEEDYINYSKYVNNMLIDWKRKYDFEEVLKSEKDDN